MTQEHEGLAMTVEERQAVMRLTLCGSTRFRAEYELWNKRLTLAGFLVYSVSGFGHSGDDFTDEEKEQLDRVHLAKIDAAHAIVVINPGGYIGASTRREIEHATRCGKTVYYTHDSCPTVYQLRTGPDGANSLRYRAFSYEAAREEGRRSTPGDVEAWTWLAGRTNLELSHGYDEPDDGGAWRVHSVNGGVNDREWTLRGSGATPLEAVLSARAALLLILSEDEGARSARLGSTSMRPTNTGETSSDGAE